MEKILEFKKDGYDIKVFTAFDENPDTSFIGEYTDNITNGVIVRCGERPGEFYEDLTDDEKEAIPTCGREFRGFQPYAGGEEVGTANYKANGKQDYRRMEGLNNGDWCFLGIIARVYRRGIELGSASVWWFESDSDTNYLEDEGRNIADEALTEAKANRKALCEEVA